MKAVNLIPLDERSGASAGVGRAGGAAYVVLGLVGVLAVFALLYGLAARHISSSRSEVASLTIRTQQAQARTAQLAPYTSFVAMRQQRAQAVSQLVNSRFDWAHAFHELGRVLPSNVSLTSLDGTVGSTSGAAGSSSAPAPATATPAAATATSATAGSSVASATPPGSVPTLTIQGCATGQKEVALMLDRLRLIDGVSEVVLQSSTKSGSTVQGGGGSGGGCEGGEPAFSVEVIFEALPSASAVDSSTSRTTISTSASATASAPSTGAAR
jgi:Tfp pilus assembly protein PilN